MGFRAASVSAPDAWGPHAKRGGRAELGSERHLTIRDDDAVGNRGFVADPGDLGFAVLLFQRERVEAARGWTGDVRSVALVFGVVAGAEEPVGFRLPVEFAAQVRADRAEDHVAHVDDRIVDLPAGVRKKI